MRARGDDEAAATFDVICAGEALWKLATPGARFSGRSGEVRLRPSGGAVDVALSLAKEGLRVGLAAVLTDDDLGRASRERLEAAGVDVRAVRLSPRRTSFVVVDGRGGATHVGPTLEDSAAFEVPRAWSARVLLLSGLSPLIAHAASLCKAARKARREGSLVMLDFNASLHEWAGRDARVIRMVLAETDVARCSVADLAVLGMEVRDVRAALRPNAVLVVTDVLGGAVATGPFGEVVLAPREAIPLAPSGAGDAFTAALSAELARPVAPGESVSALWHRVLRRGRGAARARSARGRAG